MRNAVATIKGLRSLASKQKDLLERAREELKELGTLKKQLRNIKRETYPLDERSEKSFSSYRQQKYHSPRHSQESIDKTRSLHENQWTPRKSFDITPKKSFSPRISLPSRSPNRRVNPIETSPQLTPFRNSTRSPSYSKSSGLMNWGKSRNNLSQFRFSETPIRTPRNFFSYKRSFK